MNAPTQGKLLEQTLTTGIEEVIRRRRAIHSFVPGPNLSKEQWQKLFDLTALTPSSYNFQPWDFVVVEDVKKREELLPLCWNQKQVMDSVAVLAVLGDKNPHRRDDQILQQFVDGGYFNDEVKQTLKGSIDVVYPNEERRVEHAVCGASLAAMTMMLVADGMGLGTAPLIGFDPKGVAEYLKVPNDYMVVMMMCIGHPSHKELPRQPRRGYEDFVHWGAFGGKA
ncbi:MAG: nitroreductase family protein [Betaproteobacteria bacterium]|nr:nitroreductase family protein [Betaproteobacteria bacterium]